MAIFSKLKLSSLALICATSVAAHGTVSNFEADGVHYEGFYYDRPLPNTSPGWQYDGANGFVGYPRVYDSAIYNDQSWVLQDPDIICKNNASPGPTSATVMAGGSVTFNWTYWIQDHHGPILTYMANCRGPCDTVNKTALEWFKIQEMGLTNGTKRNDPPYPLGGKNLTSGSWAVDTLIANGYYWTVQIPPSLAPGNYVIRHEIIALHFSMFSHGIQAYPMCFNFKVTGRGTVNPKGTVGTKLYSLDQPAFSYDVWNESNPLPDFPLPGPPLWNGK